jgi:outer membrane murein-binding lipoprotein Lpp
MQSGAALKEVDVFSNGNAVHVSIAPDTSKIVDEHGDTITMTRRGFMARLDVKVGERVELSKGTLMLLGAGVILLNLAFSYGGSILGWTRQDEQIRTKVETTAKTVDELNTKVDKLTEAFTQQQIQDAKVQGYKLGQSDAGATGHKK